MDKVQREEPTSLLLVFVPDEPAMPAFGGMEMEGSESDAKE